MKYQRVVGIVMCLVLVLAQLLVPGNPSIARADTLTKSPANPVLVMGNVSGATSVIYDPSTGTYKMWFAHGVIDPAPFDTRVNAILGLWAGSDIVANIITGNYQAVANNDSAQLYAAIQYLAGLSNSDLNALITAAHSVISYATSPNGTDWTYVRDVMPSAAPPAWYNYIGSVSVLKISASSYQMWYSGSKTDGVKLKAVLTDLSQLSASDLSLLLTNLASRDIPALVNNLKFLAVVLDLISAMANTNASIGRAVSTDGIAWTEDASPVMTKNPDNTTWDGYGVGMPSVIKNGATYEMWYTGTKISIDLMAIQNATTAAGIEAVLRNGLVFAVGRATSADGITWVKDGANPVLNRGSGSVWDSYGVISPCVIKDGATYEMWFTGYQGTLTSIVNYLGGTANFNDMIANTASMAIGHATSTNGIVWTKDAANPVISKGAGAAWDKMGVSFPAVIKTGSSYQIWYTSVTADPQAAMTSLLTGAGMTASMAGARMQIGYAYSNANTMLSLAVTPVTPAVALGGTLQFTATATYSNGTTGDVTAIVPWASSDISKATISASGLATTLATGPTTISATSGSASGSTVLTVTAAVYASLNIVPAAPSVPTGATIQLQAMETYTDGTLFNRTNAATWASLTPGVATVNAATGLATAVAAGTATITAQYGGHTASTTFTTLPATMVSMAVTGSSTVVAGLTTQLTATATLSDTTPADKTGALTGTVWASLSPAVATVAADGLVTGRTTGTAIIQATNNGFRGTKTITVTAPTLVSVAISPATPTLVIGQTVTFTATGTYTDGSKGTVSVTWASSDPTKATIINTSGVATAIAAGSPTITATSTVAPATTTLTVTAATLNSIAVTTGSVSKNLGLTQQFTAIGTYSDTNTADITALVNWSSSSNANATIASGGLATTRAVGTASITASLGVVTSPAVTLTVTAPALVSIAVTPANSSIPLGRAVTFTATGTYTDGSTGVVVGAAWNSTNLGIATIGAASGIAATVGLGPTNITATSGTISGTTLLTVAQKELDSIAITPANPSLAAGNSLQMAATGTYSDPTHATITNSVLWSSTSAASITASGNATGSAIGSATITAALNGKTGTTTVTVTAAVVNAIEIAPLNAVIFTNASKQYRAVAIYSDGSRIDVTTTCQWNSGTPLTIAFSGVTKGLAQANTAVGVVNISATFGGQMSPITTLKVTAATLSSIAVTTGTPSVAAGRTAQFTATGTYSDASPADLTSFVNWQSSSNTTARVNSAGLATTYTMGSAGITASLGAITSPASTLAATAAVLDSIDVTPKAPSVTLVSGGSATLQFKAIGINSDGSTSDITATAGIWGSTTPGVASIPNAAGVSNIAGAGTTTISATSGGKTNSVVVTVLADTIPPSITLTSPAQGAVTNDKNLTISGSVDDVNATVRVIINGLPPVAVTLTAGNFNYGALLNNGRNTIVVEARDTAGNTGSTGTYTVTVDANKPAITITAPTEMTLTNRPSATITGTINGATTATLVFNGVSSTITLAAGIFSVPVTLLEGTNIIVVKAYTTGHASDADYLGTSGSRKVILDSRAPGINIVTPTAGSTVSVSNVAVSGSTNDPSITTAILNLNGFTRTINVVGGQFREQVTLSTGANTINVIATDEAGNLSTNSAITVTLDTSKPAVSLMSPINKSLTNVAAQMVSGNVSDPSITTVNLILNGTSQSIVVAPDGSFGKVVTLAGGANTIEVTATNNAVPPVTGSSGVVNVTLDITNPVLTIGLTDPTAAIEITVISNEDLGANPAVTVNPGSTPVTMNLVSTGKWVGTYGSTGSPIAANDYTVTISARDKAGNPATATAVFTKKSITTNGSSATTVANSTTTLQVQTNGAVNNASLSMTTQMENPSGNVGTPSGAANASGVYLQINADPAILNNLKEIYIQVNYDPAKLPAGTDESTLRLYLWDLESGTWKIVPGSGVNVASHYIYGTVTHLSDYGGFGTATPPSNGGGGNGGSGIIVAPGTTNVTNIINALGKFVASVTATSDDTMATLRIPADTTGKRSDGTPIDKITMIKTTLAVPLPEAGVMPSFAYEMGPSGSTFDPAIMLTIKYDASKIPAGFAESNLKIAFFDTATAKWVTLANSTVDTVNHTISAPVSHFTSFSVFAFSKPANLTLANLAVTPARVNPGESVTISVNVANSGDLSGVKTLTLKINNVNETTQDVTLAGGGSQTVSFKVTRSAAGTYAVDVNGMTGSFIVGTATPPITPPPQIPATFTVAGLTVTPARTAIGQPVVITVNVSNSGQASGSYDVVLKIGGSVISTQKVTLSGGETQKVTFNVTRDTLGAASVDVNGATGTFTVARPATFAVSALSVSPIESSPGGKVTITAQLTNSGELEGKYQVTLKVNDAVAETREVTLAAGASDKVSFVVSKDAIGTYSVDINGQKGTFVVLGTASQVNWPVIGGIIALALIIAALVIGILVRRRHSAV